MIYTIDAEIFFLALSISLIPCLLYIYVISPFIKHIFICKKIFDDFNEQIKPLMSEIKQHEEELIEFQKKLKHINHV